MRTTAFIEVTGRGGKSLLINTFAIERITDEGEYRRLTFIGGSGAADPERLDVSETYEALKKTIGRFQTEPARR